MTVIHRSPRSITLHTDDSARGVCLGPAGDRADDGVVLRPPGTRPRVGDVPAATPTTKDTIDMIQRRPINLLVQPRCHRIMIMWQRGNEHLSRSVTGESSLLRTVQINQGNNIQQQVAWILFVCSRERSDKMSNSSVSKLFHVSGPGKAKLLSVTEVCDFWTVSNNVRVGTGTNDRHWLNSINL